jgi:predicted RNA-binding Zn ribbon-like protein
MVQGVVVDAAGLIALGGDPGLAFINSRAAPARKPMDLITDGGSYLAFLRDTALIDDTDAAEIRRRFAAAELDVVAAEAAGLREWLRPVLPEWAAAAHRTLPPPVVTRLNEVLAADHRYPALQLDAATGEPGLRQRRSWTAPRQLLVPPIAALAALLTTADRALVRNCESPSCTLWFHDQTKAHRRRWCTMAVCGNREKARRHRSQESG